MSIKNGRGVLLIVAAAANALLALLLLLVGIVLTGGLINLALVAGNTSWSLLGSRAAAELGEEFVALLTLFGADPGALLQEFVTAQGLPPFDRFARDLLAALFVGVALFIPAGVASGLAAMRIWRLTPAADRGVLQLYAVVVTLLGAIGLLIAAAPHLIWGSVLLIGLLTLLALRRPRAVKLLYSA
ncbi:MAG: hypothetical protein ACKOGF_03890 [Candidatus Limnocylindrus sp.]